jgi:hypothetical protein
MADFDLRFKKELGSGWYIDEMHKAALKLLEEHPDAESISYDTKEGRITARKGDKLENLQSRYRSRLQDNASVAVERSMSGTKKVAERIKGIIGS